MNLEDKSLEQLLGELPYDGYKLHKKPLSLIIKPSSLTSLAKQYSLSEAAIMTIIRKIVEDARVKEAR